MSEEENILSIKDFFLIEQPLGDYIVCKIKASKLLRITQPFPREYDEDKNAFVGIQRKKDEKKISELKDYINTSDACFPNSIIANLDTSYLLEMNDEEVKIDLTKTSLFVIDGQHRIECFRGEEISNDFELLVTIFLGLSVEEQAYLFSTINNKQKKLNSSLVQDLNDLFQTHTPEKIVHVITRLFNSKDESPWKDKIKVLGRNIRKDGVVIKGIMSQYTFAKEIIKLIYNTDKDYFLVRDILKESQNKRAILDKSEHLHINNNHIFWKYYVAGSEDFMYKSLNAYFGSIANTFEGWGDNNYITSKTTGYVAFMKLYRLIFEKTDAEDKLIQKPYFNDILQKMKGTGKISKMNSDNYPAGAAGQNKLFGDLLKAFEEIQ